MSARTRTESDARPANSPTSPSIVERNRRNAAHSTGPRTDGGKARSRWNALKHGLLCREMVIPAGEGKESRIKLQHLISELRQDLKPVGVLEEIMVEKIAGCYWRLRRVMRAEIGEIKKRLSFSASRASEQTSDALKPLQNAMQDLDVLDELRKCVERDGGPLSEDLERFRTLRLMPHHPAVTEVLDQLLDDDDSSAPQAGAADAPDGQSGDADGAAQCREQLLALIDSRRRILRTVVEEETERGREEYFAHLEAALSRYHLPDRSASMRLRLYETSISRELYRAMRELRELQCERRGRSPRRGRKAATL
jgi:hypothetical protein